MRVKALNTIMLGKDDDPSTIHAGTVVEMSGDRLERMLALRAVEPVETKSKAELKADKAAAEAAAKEEAEKAAAEAAAKEEAEKAAAEAAAKEEADKAAAKKKGKGKSSDDGDDLV